MLATASAVKEDGHPDWLQLAVFLRALGMLFLCWTDDDNAALRSISAQEWLTKNSTWVVGEAIPSSIECPVMNKLNVDHCNAKEAGRGAARHCGLQNVTLPWTPDEYLYLVLSHNRTTLPAEALDIVRFWSFRTWYEQDNYDELCSPQDMDTKEWIISLAEVAAVSADTVQNLDVNDELEYYLQLAEKYLPRTLHW
uniref:Inositol oxygenase n=1 Tax=Peronospora matthiolae TaxID=2874970 RepID=A0AAV1UV17_9STRA